MNRTEFIEVRLRQRFRAPPDRVFDAWLDPEVAGRWLFATAWRPMSRVSIEARAGGSFRFADGLDGPEVIQTGRYLEIARPRRLVFTLSGAQRGRGSTRVRVEIVPLDAGCELTLTHEGVSSESVRPIEGRWTGMLYGLETILGKQSARGGRPGPRP